MQIDLQPAPPDFLSDLGLVHKYPLHINLVNNETGFALYVETPANEDGWEPLFGDQELIGAEEIHHTEYEADRGPETYGHGFTYSDEIFLRVREVDDNGNPGAWSKALLHGGNFTKNVNPPDVLEELGFDRFDSVTWLEGLEADKDYQVQMWFDMDDNGQLDSQGRYVRGINITHNLDGTVTETPGDHYYWQKADLYSGIHDLNTDAEDFNIDIDNDGTMDFFTTQDLIITLAEGTAVNDAQGGAGDDTIQGNSEKNRLYGNAGNDSLTGGAGNDVLYGHAGADRIRGDNGNDYIVGGSGDDRLGGGPGNDVFVFGPRDGNYEDVIIDFNDGADRLDLRRFTTLHSMDDLDFSLSGNGTDSYIDLTQHGGGTIILADFTEPLYADDFLFA